MLRPEDADKAYDRCLIEAILTGVVHMRKRVEQFVLQCVPIGMFCGLMELQDLRYGAPHDPFPWFLFRSLMFFFALLLMWRVSYRHTKEIEALQMALRAKEREDNGACADPVRVD